MKSKFLLLLALFCTQLLPAQTAGSFDLSWDGDGMLDLGTWEWGKRPLCRMAGLQLHVAVQAADRSLPSVRRYNVDGSLDPSFGQGGIREIGVLGTAIEINDLQVAASGEVYVLVTDPYQRILRLRPDGSDDPSFHSIGLHVGMLVKSVQLLDDGRILACGTTNPAALLCLLPNGDVDLSFGQDGMVTLMTQQDTQEFTSVGSLSNHNIVASGMTTYYDSFGCGWMSAAVVAIYSPQGQLLASNVNSIGAYEGVRNMIILKQGGFALAGPKFLRTLDENGNFQPDFDVSVLFNHPDASLWGLGQQADGEMVVGLRQHLITFATGGPDDAGSIYRESFNVTNYTYNQLLTQSDRKMLALRYVYTGSGTYEFTMIRFNGNLIPQNVNEAQSPMAVRMELSAFPNPSHGQPISLHIDSPKSESLQLQCRDIAGRVIMPPMSVQLHAGVNEGIQMPLPSTLPAGVYFLQAQTDDYAQTLKLVVE